MNVAVGSTNPVKIRAVRKAFKKVFPNEKIIIQGIDVSSGVSSQPMNDEESILGATNRAKRALKNSSADYGVGIEGGLNKTGKFWFDCGWIVVIDKTNKRGIGSSMKMHTPQKMILMIKNNKMELGEVDDLVFKRMNSKQKKGHFGLMTNGAITRSHAYRDGVICALARFLHKNLY